jgi:hypothetical protein
MIFLIIFLSFLAGAGAGIWFALYFTSLQLKKRGVDLKKEFEVEDLKK